MTLKFLFFSADFKARLVNVISSGADTKCTSVLFMDESGGENSMKWLQVAKRLCCKCKVSKLFGDPQLCSVA